MKDIFSVEYDRIFSDGLKKYGFVLLSNSDIFVRLNGDEIIQTIYVRLIGLPLDSQLVFTIGAAVRSVYVEKISKRKLKKRNYSIYDFLSDEDKSITPWQEYCYVCDKSNICEVVSKALNDTLRLIVPVYERIKSLHDYVEYSLATQQSDLSFEGKDNEYLVWVNIAEVLDCESLSKAMAGGTSVIPQGQRLISDVAVKVKQEVLQEKYLIHLQHILEDPRKLENAYIRSEELKKKALLFLSKNGLQ